MLRASVAMNPPISEPATPSAIVQRKPIGCLPGRIRRARRPTNRPQMIQEMIPWGWRMPAPAGIYSHSIVLGGFDEMSSATLFTCGISLMMRLETVSKSS
jgi:hypothetical protein